MCAQAISFARLSNLIFSAEDRKSGGVINGPKIFESSSCHHKPKIIRLMTMINRKIYSKNSLNLSEKKVKNSFVKLADALF